MEQMDHSQQPGAPYTEFFSWGSDSDGQLALANSDDDSAQYYKQSQFYELPKSLSFDILIQQISCGDYHTAFISGEGFVFSVGKNNEGQLGVGDPSLTHSSAPLLIDSFPKGQATPTLISCGGSHTAVVFSNGDMYSWGSGNYGALGLGSQNNLFAPQRVQLRENYGGGITFVDCGKRHSLVIDSFGSVYVSGDNSFRQLGFPHTEKVLEYTRLQDFPFKAVKCSAGLDHSLLLTDDDKIYGSGNNLEGNLGLGHQYSSDNFLQVHGVANLKIKQICAGRHSAAITQDGRLYVWGPVFKGDKPLLLPQELRSNKLMLSISIGEKASAVIDEDFHIYTWGITNNQGQLGRRCQADYGNGNDEGQKMPQIVDSLACKVVTQVHCGLDFVVALGQDYDENGIPYDNLDNNNSNRLSLSQHLIDKKNINSNANNNNNINNYSPYSQNQNSQAFKDQSSLQLDAQMLTQQLQQNTQSSQGSNSYNPKASSIQSTYERIPTPNQQQQQQPTTSNYQQYNSNQGLIRKNEEQQQQQMQKATNISGISNSSNKLRDTSSQPQPSAQSYSQTRINTKDVPNLPSKQPNNIGSGGVVLGDRVLSTSSSVALPQTVYQSNNNAELYKQLDQLREETFALKQKNRDLQQQMNILREENDQLLKNAEDEIKRMTGFIDQYTAELDLTRKQHEQELESKLMEERRKNEDYKMKMYEEQSQMQERLDRVQKEMEMLKKENSSLKLENQDLSQREQRLQEQLQTAQYKLTLSDSKVNASSKYSQYHHNYLQNRENREAIPDKRDVSQRNVTTGGTFELSRAGEAENRNMSPITIPKTQDNYNYQETTSSAYISKSPLNNCSNNVAATNYYPFNSRQAINQKSNFGMKEGSYVSQEQSNNLPPPSRTFSQEHSSNIPPKPSSQRETLFQGGQIVNMRQRDSTSGSNNNHTQESVSTTRPPPELYYSKDTAQSHYSKNNALAGNASPLYMNRKDNSNYKKERDSPRRISQMLGISSPIRQEIAHESLQPSDFIKGGYSIEQDENKQMLGMKGGGIEDYWKATESSSQQKNMDQKYYIQPQYSEESQKQQQFNQRKNVLGSSPLNNMIIDEAYNIHNKLQQQIKSPPITDIYASHTKDHYRKGGEDIRMSSASKAGGYAQENVNNGGGNALNDVKNRLAAMQKNKEDLEEKLKAYEAKIKQHFNR